MAWELVQIVPCTPGLSRPDWLKSQCPVLRLASGMPQSQGDPQLRQAPWKAPNLYQLG